MELREALGKAAQILNEERIRPTIGYEAVSSKEDIAGIMLALSRQQNLHTERRQRPRRVHESPYEFSLKSTNCDLLLALFSQVQLGSREAFVATILSRISDPTSARLATTAKPFPSWSNFISELPLVVEFCVRVGCKASLFRAVAESQMTRGLVLSLMQLEDLIALNFNLLTDNELDQLAAALHALRMAAYRKTYKSRRRRGASGTAAINPEYDPTLAPIATEIVAACDGVIEECTQARYWYLKGALQQNSNLEINDDKTKVEDHLKRLGFSGPLLQTLSVAEQDFRASATPFELKNCLAHLRSFLEGLHEQACKPIAAKVGTSAPKKWGKTTEMLRNNAILSVQEEMFAASLYTLISDEGVHPLIAEREYARLLRNMVIEYGLMFLTKLEKAGIDLR